MKRNDFPRNTILTEAWRRLGVPTNNINQATRWHDKGAGVWTLWIENPHGVSFVTQDNRNTLIVTPWRPDGAQHSNVHMAKAHAYWEDLHEAAAEEKIIRIMAIKWRKDATGAFVEEQHGATIPVYWRQMKATMDADGDRVVLTEADNADIT